MYKRNAIGFLIGPLLFIIFYLFGEPFLGNSSSVIAVGLWMITWWVSEAAPIPVTALLPIVLFPLTGIFDISQATAPYASPIIFLFMGGFMIALGLEKHNLHKRLALSILQITGSSGNGVVLGFMLSTALLSMWISNTATTVMMLPIAISVVNLLTKDGLIESEKTFALSLMLGIAYSANIGGTITLIGTPPNVVMAGYLNQILDYQIGFSQWMLIALPIGLSLIVITYFLLTRLLFPNNLKEVDGSSSLIKEQIRLLGKISREEKLVLAIFSITALGWILKPQINLLIGENLLTDHVTAMIGGTLMFITPVNLSDGSRLLNWEDTQKLPWGILILFGGGMTLAKALAHVGIIDQIGQFVQSYQGINLLLLIALVTLIVLFMTEFMSNVALVTILIPVIIAICQGMNIAPLSMVIPVTIASSCAFMMPISTPPNAIVYSSGYVSMSQMLRAGIWLNIISVIILTITCYWLVPIIF